MIKNDQINEIIQPYGMTLIEIRTFKGDRENILVDLSTSHGIYVRIYRDRKVNSCDISNKYSITSRDWLSIIHIFEVENIDYNSSACHEIDFLVYFRNILTVLQRYIEVIARYADRKYFKKKEQDIIAMNKRMFEEMYPGCIGD